MKAILTLDSERLAEAKRITGLEDLSQVVDEALLNLIQREAAQRLIELGGSSPDLEAPPRRRFEPAAAE